MGPWAKEVILKNMAKINQCQNNNKTQQITDSVHNC